MPVKWDDPKSVDSFKQDAVKAGFNPQEVEMFVEKNKPKTMPLAITETGDVQLKQDSQPTPQDSLEVTPFKESPTQPMAQPVIQKQESVPEQQTDKIITQPFGNRSSIEKYSGGTNLGTDYRASVGTQMLAPQGEWKVVKAQPGFNQGSGNYVQIQNTKTGETIGFEHLSKIGVRPGSIIKGGQYIGKSGNSGNSTGPHISLPYKDPQGNYKDINSTPYINQIF